MNGPGAWIFEHTMPAWGLWTAAGAAVALCVLLAWWLLRLDRLGVLLVVMRLLFLAGLGWCLWMPSVRHADREMLRPRLLVLVDTSASMATAPDGAGTTRWDTARAVLRQGWPKSAAGRFAVDVHPFGAETGARIDAPAAAELVPDGTSTRLRAGIERLAGLHRGQPVAGMLVLSDGLDTRELRDDWASGPWPFPIHAVRLERPVPAVQRPPDVRVETIETPLRVVVGWESRLTAAISGEAPAGRAISVRLYRNDQLLQEIPTQLGGGGGTRDVSFQLDNPATGSFTYRVEVPPLEGETQTNDNASAVSVQVVDAQNRLLYLEDVPRWESKYLIRALRAGGTVTPLAFVRGPDGRFLTYGGRGTMTLDLTAEQLAGYKMIVLGDLDAATLRPERAEAIAKFVAEGGNLVLLGGAKGWGDAGLETSPLKKLLPVERKAVAPVQEGTFPVTLTDEGRAHPVFKGEGTVWEALPPVLTVFPGATVTRGGTVLANARTPAGEEPLIAVQRYGQGKVAVLLTESMWRWALAPGEDSPYQRFWNQMLNWLSPEQEKLAAFEVDLFGNLSSLHLGEGVDLSARVGGENGAAAAVTCEITAPDGRVLPFPMAAQAITTATGKSSPGFGLKFTPEASGLHKARAVAVLEGRKVESGPFSFFVRSVNAESTPRPANLDLLEKLAGSSGGRLIEPGEVGALVDGLQSEGREESRVSYRSMWNHGLTLGLLMGLLTFEWLVRRKSNMA
ncbi:MAG: hypothetical protein FJ221_02115 [Lentisphaerae bacterium]|nr:hypothetical protein [Lentisphaerota bacterium]